MGSTTSIRLLLTAFVVSIAGCQTLAPPSPELAYCERLFEMHERYLLRIRSDGGELRDPAADYAVDRCRHGGFDEGIPILEAKLQRGRLNLPPR